MTLSQQILALEDGIRTTRQLAELVYGAPATATQLAYVRIVLRQRRGRNSPAQQKYYCANRETIRRKDRERKQRRERTSRKRKLEATAHG